MDRAALVSKLAIAGVLQDELMRTADSYSWGRLDGLLEKTRRSDAESESFDYEWRYLVAQPSLDQSVLKLWGQLPGTDGRVVLNALERKESQFSSLDGDNAGQRRADALTALCLDSLTCTDGDGEQGRAVTVAEIFVDATLSAASGGEAGVSLSTGTKVGLNTLTEILCGLSPTGRWGSTASAASREGANRAETSATFAPSSASYVGGHSPNFRWGRGSNPITSSNGIGVGAIIPTT